MDRTRVTRADAGRVDRRRVLTSVMPHASSRASRETRHLPMFIDPERAARSTVPTRDSRLRSSNCVRPPRLTRLRGAGDGTRTRNLLITNQLLYPLSYASVGTVGWRL